jgi:hypothetical protein
VNDEPFTWTLLEGAKGVQLAEKGLESSRKRAWLRIEPLLSASGWNEARRELKANPR